MDPAVIVGFGMDKFRKRMAELLADPRVPDADAFAVLWSEIADYDAAHVAESRARYKDFEDPFDEYADDDDDSEEDEETESGGGERRRQPGDDEKKNPRVEEEAPRILLSRL